MRSTRSLLIAAAVALVLTACGPSFPTLQPDAGPAVGGAETAADPTATSGEVTETAAQPADTSAAPTDTASPTETQIEPTDAPVEAAAECPFRPDLHATNPAAVSLASGKVQLVEFFAFW